MLSERLVYLFEKCVNGLQTEAERQELQQLIQLPELEVDVEALFAQALRAEKASQLVPNGIDQLVLMNIFEAANKQDDVPDRDEDSEPAKVYPLWKKIGWVAAAIALVVAGSFWWFNSSEKMKSPQLAVEQPDVQPGQTGAVLTLADGRTIVLDNMGNGVVADDHGAHIQLENGSLLYGNSGTDDAQVYYNTMTTPRGRQFQLQLPDGTKVWLNAASSLTYPTRFAEKDRKVSISGEAYFEVAPNKTKPFLVSINKDVSIEVLGTHFNINAYPEDNSIHTTLIEGAVNVWNGEQKSILKPNQQARISSQKMELVENVDVDEALAWKNGLFNFSNKSIQEVMKQLERWYDLEVIYEASPPVIEFWGKMQRDVNLSNILLALERANLTFRIEADRKLIVMTNEKK